MGEHGYPPERRDDLDPLTRAVSDALDELLFRHHGISTSWSNPESFIKWLGERGYVVVPMADPPPQRARVAGGDGGEAT